MEKDKINISLRIVSIKTIRFSLDNANVSKEINKNAFIFNISAKVSIDPNSKSIAIEILQDIFLDKELQTSVCQHVSRIVFEIVNFDSVIKHNIEKKDIKIPDDLMTTLISISLSTSRGILASKIEGSNLEGVYMPIVDPKSFKPVLP